jgi:methionyl-tRNA formyltransferase
VGELNSARTAAGLEEAAPDVVVVYGTNLIREPLLSRWAGRMVNLHLGLSPYYRGTGTNFYPLLNEEPEYVGATIHLIDPGIDSGPILRHACPEIVADDRPHTIGCKAIQAAVCALVDVLRHFDAARARAVPQWQPAHARLYRRKDYHPRQVVELYRKLDEGLIPRYLAEQEERRARVRLVR